MKQIVEYLLSKDGRRKADGSIAEESLYKEVQGDTNNEAGYHTLDVTDGMKKYKRGFVTWNDDTNSVCLLAFNKSEDFANLLGMENDWEDLEALYKGECYKRYHNETVIRIW